MVQSDVNVALLWAWKPVVVTSPPGGMRGPVLRWVSVCLSVLRNSITTRPNFTKFFCMLPVAMARSSSDGVAICCVLPVLLMTSCFHTMGKDELNSRFHGRDIFREIGLLPRKTPSSVKSVIFREFWHFYFHLWRFQSFISSFRADFAVCYYVSHFST